MFYFGLGLPYSVSFNSLFEMLIYDDAPTLELELPNAFNSLFEMRRGAYRGTAPPSRWLSILYLRCS